jgi:hypothetical protein
MTSTDANESGAAAAAPIQHPSWCSPSHCRFADPESRHHYSRPAQARGRRDVDVTVTVQLFASTDQPEGFPAHVGLSINYPSFGGDEEVDLDHAFDPELAQSVGRLLTSAGRQART